MFGSLKFKARLGLFKKLRDLQEFDKRSDEISKRFQRDLFLLPVGFGIPEGEIQILKSDFSSSAEQEEEKLADSSAHPIRKPKRKDIHSLDDSSKAEVFEEIPTGEKMAELKTLLFFEKAGIQRTVAL